MSTLPITAQSVRVKCCELGIRLKRCDGKYRCEVRCTVAMDVWEKLRKLANTRGLSVSQFAQLFIEIAVDERLIGKIIDDPVPQAAPDSAPRIGRPRRLAVTARLIPAGQVVYHGVPSPNPGRIITSST